MRWIVLLFISCLIGFTGCSDNARTNDNNPGGGTDVGFNLGEDATSGTDVSDADVGNADVAENPSDTPEIPDDVGEPKTCASSAECTGTRSVCDPMSQLCVDCLFDSQCADGGRCIELECKTEGTCESDRECANVAGKPVCNQALRECVASCNNSLDCGQGNVCDPVQKQCVQCASNLDCGDGERCVATQCEAFLACQSDNQCTPHGLLCDVDRGACNECENDASCPNAYHCTEGRCVIDTCANGETHCSNNQIKKCVDGKRVETVKSCHAPEACVQQGNAASCGSCTADSQCAAGFECNAGACKRAAGVVCPTALAEARIVGTTDYKNEIHAQPLETIELAATRSSGDSALTYEWSIIKRPASSQARLTPDAASDKPKLWIDLAGEYEIELVVYDAAGVQSCESSIVKIHVVPGKEIHIQLTWNAPAVHAPTNGNGTDMDLHYRHPQGTKWNDQAYTVFWKHRTSSARWGSEPGRANKATLDIDDLWGATTENINHAQPLNGSYEIGVHYYNDNGYGGADANIRI